jgi:hypothetical protein
MTGIPFDQADCDDECVTRASGYAHTSACWTRWNTAADAVMADETGPMEEADQPGPVVVSAPCVDHREADLDRLARLDEECNALAWVMGDPTASEATRATLRRIYNRTLTEWAHLDVHVPSAPIPYVLESRP